MEKIKETMIRVINGAEISAIEKNGEYFVPVKPICQAIGVEFPPQFTKIKENPILGSTVTIIVMVGADGRTREMVCLPEKFIYGWLTTINPNKVSPEARESVVKYQAECYDILYSHFHRKAHRSETLTLMEIEQRKIVEDLARQRKEISAALKDAEGKLKEIQDARVDDAILPDLK